MAKGRRGRDKKAAAARRATEKFAQKLQALEEPVEPVGMTVLLRSGANPGVPPARRREPLKLNQFDGLVFKVKDKEKMKQREAVVDAAIEDGRKNAGLTESNDLANHVFEVTGFLRKQHSKDVTPALRRYVSLQCAEEDRSKKQTPWWGGIKSLATAKASQLVFVERDDKGKAKTIWSCRKKAVHYPADSGLVKQRAPIPFSVEKYGEPGATQFALEESQSALGLLEKFKKQIGKLRSAAQKTNLDAPSPRDIASRFADDVCSTTLPHAGRRRCGKTSRRARRRAVPSRASRAARPRTSLRVSSAWRSAA